MQFQTATIAQGMMMVALLALNLSVARLISRDYTTYPTVWVFLGIIDLVACQRLIRRRPLRASHYTFMVVLLVTYIVMANFAVMGRILVIGPIVRWYQQQSGVELDFLSPGILAVGEIWMACVLSLGFAVALAVGAGWLERRRGWDIAAFFRGALLGFVIACLLLTVGLRLGRSDKPSSFHFASRLIFLSGCMLVGGFFGLSRLKSRPLEPSEFERRMHPGA